MSLLASRIARQSISARVPIRKGGSLPKRSHAIAVTFLANGTEAIHYDNERPILKNLEVIDEITMELMNPRIKYSATAQNYISIMYFIEVL